VNLHRKEYDYAVEKGVHVLAFIHKDIKTIPYGQVDAAPDKAAKLASFTTKVSANRMADFWTDRDNLHSKVIVSLTKAFADFPRIGWVRADTAASEDILGEINKVRNQIDALTEENVSLKAQLVPQVPNIAPLSDIFVINFRHKSTSPHANSVYDGSLSLTWGEIFAIVGPSFFRPSPSAMIPQSIIGALYERERNAYEFTLFSSLEGTIKIQLAAYGFLRIFEAEAIGGGVQEFLQLTDLGKRMLIELAAVRAAPAS
jgi:hypothetical protein